MRQNPQCPRFGHLFMSSEVPISSFDECWGRWSLPWTMLESWIKSLEISQREKQPELVIDTASFPPIASCLIGLYEHYVGGKKTCKHFFSKISQECTLIHLTAASPAVLCMSVVSFFSLCNFHLHPASLPWFHMDVALARQTQKDKHPCIHLGSISNCRIKACSQDHSLPNRFHARFHSSLGCILHLGNESSESFAVEATSHGFACHRKHSPCEFKWCQEKSWVCAVTNDSDGLQGIRVCFWTLVDMPTLSWLSQQQS